MNEELFQRL